MCVIMSMSSRWSMVDDCVLVQISLNLLLHFSELCDRFRVFGILWVY